MEAISTETAPQAIGPYSQAIKANGLLFASGQIPLNPATMEIVGANVTEQTDRVMQNLQAVLNAAGTDLGKTVKTTVYLSDMALFAECEPQYVELDGWEDPGQEAWRRSARDGLGALPANCRKYVQYVEETLGVPGYVVGVG